MLIASFAPFAHAATIPANGVQIVAPANPAAVAKYDKLELLISLTTTATNVFNPDSTNGGIDLSATFTAPNNATTKVNGFYDGTSWRVRFAPTQTGSWTFTVAATDSGGTATWSGGSFTCVTSTYPGFARIDGTYLRFTEGQAQFAVGHNNGWQYDVEQPSFSSMAAQGENLLSFWMNSPWKTPADPEPRCPIENVTQGIGVYNQPACTYLDGVVSRAEAAGVYLLPSIWSHGNLRYWDANNKNDPLNHSWGQGWWSNLPYSPLCSAANFFQTSNGSNDTPQWKAQKNLYRYILARWGYSRAIIGWVALVEIEGTSGYGTNGTPSDANPTQATAWCGSVRNYFAANDPYRLNSLSKYPIGVSQTDWTSGSTTWANGCDLAAIDSYTQQTNSIAVATAISNEIGGGGGVTAMRSSNRPSLVAEFGAQEPNSNYNTYQPTHFHNGIWAGTAAGACMTPLLWCDAGQFPMLTDPNIGGQLRTQLQNLSQFMAGINYIDATGFTPASVSVNATGFNARGMRLSDRGFGWMQNTVGNAGGQTLTVNGLSAGTYNVFWYDTWASGATPLNPQPQIVTVTTSGSLSAAVPTPTTPRADLAFKFFANAAPTISFAASANPSTVTGTSTTLTVLGADDAGEANLVYHWKIHGTPLAPPTFSVNDSNAAKTTVATFNHNDGGLPTLVYVTVTDAEGASVDSAFVAITVVATPTSVVITPSSATVGLNQSQIFGPIVYDQFGGVVGPAYFNPQLFSYSVSGGGTMNLATFTAGNVPGGPYTVTETYGGTVSSTATVVVVDGAPTISAVSANPSPVTGTSSALSVTASDDGGEPALKYTWSIVSAPPGASVTFTPNGTNAAKSATAQFSALGDYVLSVSAADVSTQTATQTLNITVQQTLTSIGVAPLLPTLSSTGSQQFTATPRDQFGAALSAPIVWSVSGGGSISPTGLLTAQTASGGPFTVTATNGAVVGTTTFTVSNSAPIINAVTPASNPVASTGTFIHVNATDDGGEPALTYSWSVTSAPSGANATFSASGSNAAKDTVVTFTAAGTYVIRVTATDGAGISSFADSANIVVQQTPAVIAVTPATAVIEPNATQQYSATAADQFGAPISTSFNWNASSGGSMDASGLFRAGSAQGGPFTITASVPPASGTAQLWIQHANTAPTIASVGANPATVTGTTSNLAVVASDDGGEPSLTYTWSVTAPPGGSASISPNGSNAAKNAVATFTKPGNYVFTVTVTDAGNLSASTQTTVVVNAAPTTISVSPATASVYESGTQQYSATIKDQFGVLLSAAPSWSVSGGGTISSTGLFTAGPSAGGPFTVTATAGSTSSTAQITVLQLNTPPLITSLSSGADPVTSTTLAATATDDGGEPNLTYTWSVNSAPAGGGVSFSVNNSNAAKSAQATFSATGTYVLGLTVKDSGGLTATSSLTVVVNPVPATLSVSPSAITLPINGSQQFTATALDQFGYALPVTWSQIGGAITPDGVYTAGSAPGTYLVTASAAGGAQNALVTIAQGTLTGIVATPASSTNLTTEGTTDWAHWGTSTTLSFDRKANVAAQISNYTPVGSGSLSRISTAPTLTWTDGTPTRKSTGTKSGLLMSGVNNGFSITVPADGTVRRLNVYVGVTKAKGKLTATLSDGSAPSYTDSSTVSTSGTTNREYSFQYSAVSPGATLTVTWTMLSGNASGGVSLHSATIGTGVLSGAKIVSPTGSKKKQRTVSRASRPPVEVDRASLPGKCQH